MGKRGTKPKPNAMRLFEGNRSKRPMRPEPAPKLLDGSTCPAWLGDAAKDKWNETAPMLERMGVLAETDADCLASYCVAWQEMLQATAVIDKEGIVTVSEKGSPYIHPAVNIRAGAFNRIKIFGSLLGLSPVARMGLNAEKKQDKPSDFESDAAKTA